MLVLRGGGGRTMGGASALAEAGYLGGLLRGTDYRPVFASFFWTLPPETHCCGRNTDRFQSTVRAVTTRICHGALHRAC